MWTTFIIAFVLVVAGFDLRTRKIPRQLTIAGLVIGLVYHWFHGDIRSAGLATLVAFAVGTALFALGAIGGGDVKLIIALGAILTFDTWPQAMFMSVIAAAIIGLIQVVAKRALLQTLKNMWAILKGLVTLGPGAHPVLNVQNSAMIRSPFGVAAAIGTIAVLLRV